MASSSGYQGGAGTAASAEEWPSSRAPFDDKEEPMSDIEVAEQDLEAIAEDAGESEAAPQQGEEEADVEAGNSLRSPLPSDAVTLEERPGLGMCLVATRSINPGQLLLEEAPLLVAQKGSDQVANNLKSFCAAPAAAQAAVLRLVSAESLKEDSDLLRRARLQAERCSAEAVYASKHDADVLQRAFIAFSKYGRPWVNGGVGLFAMGSRVMHSCGANTQYSCWLREGRGCFAALHHIMAGDVITMDYIPHMYCMSTPCRSEALLFTKLLRCQCARCVGVDATRAVPCPGCHPRKKGAMPDSAAFPTGKKKVRYALPNVAGTEWACQYCHEVWDQESLFPSEDGGASLETILENHVLGIVQHVGECNDTDDAELARRLGQVGKELFADLEAVGYVLGSRHWATAKLLELWCHSLRLQMLGTGESAKPLARPKVKALAEYMQKVDLVWTFCAEAGLCPSAFQGLFVQHWPPGMLSKKFLACALYCHAACSCYDDGWPDVLKRLDVPTVGKKAAEVLRDQGNKAMEASRFGEARLFFTGALFFMPDDNTLHADLSSALQKLGRAEAAAEAARHCIRLYPVWGRGHFHLALALQLAGKLEDARAAALKAAELEPKDKELCKLAAEMS